MAIKKHLILFLIVLSLLSFQFKCNKRLDCRGTVYGFEIAISAYPAKDSVNVGDTIWLEVSEPTKLIDLQTGRVIDYSGAANLGTTIGIAELISVNNFTTEGNYFFKFSLFAGSEILRPDTDRFREYNFAEINNRYEFRLGVIPQKKGVYKIFIGNASNVYRKNDQCTKANFEINFKNTNQHLYLNEIILPGVRLPSGGGVYLFKVK